jgi:His/Glu/Gln/Arg/opine family amino acid ABC transporter permease subunit
MAAVSPGRGGQGGGERIPFYRNVKVIGLLAQLVFVAVVLLAAGLLYSNVATALKTSNLPSNFGFLDARAGIPIAETPIRYSANDPYWKALLIGFLNTLKVAVVGVALATLVGVLIGVMRLSGNWLIRQIATLYVETLRNTPLAVQIIFWYSAVLLPVPPRILNAQAWPGGALFSNNGLAIPWLYPTYAFSSWLPWLAGALLVFFLARAWRRWTIRRSDRPGNVWALPLLLALLVAAAGYVVANRSVGLPDNVAHTFNPSRGRGTIFRDANGNGELDRGERSVPYAAATISIPEAELFETTQNLVESRQVRSSVFRFPRVEEGEADSISVDFRDPKQAEGLSLHFTQFPSSGLVFRDRNENEEFDAGEELNEEGRGFSGVRLVMRVEGFERRLVADRNGQIRISPFRPPEADGAAEQEQDGAAGGRVGVFGPAGQARQETRAVELDARVEIRESGPLLLSTPSVPVSVYEGGVTLTAPYLALLLALVVYTAAFIAEIVRGGIQAVPRGQREAAKAVGLSNYQTFMLVVFPQALRIIIPPMISQFLNLTKNSSLAPLAAYGELFVISTIVANQTGASIPMTIILIAAYLFISFVFALILNVVNARIALVER